MHIFQCIFVGFFTSTSYFQMDRSRRLIRVGKTSAPQLRCIFARRIDFWTIYQRHGTLSIDFEGPKIRWGSDESVSSNESQTEVGAIYTRQSGEFAKNVCFDTKNEFIEIYEFESLDFSTKLFSYRHPSESLLPLTSQNRCTECQDVGKSIRNRFPMKKYILAVLWKS